MDIRGLIISTFVKIHLNNQRVITVLLFMVSLFIAPLSFSADKNAEPLWTAWKDNENTSIHYRNTQNDKLIEIKAQITVKSSIAGFILFLQDTQIVHQWLDNAKSSKTLEQSSLNKNVFITYFNGFWPVQPRYMLLASTYKQRADLSVEIQVQNIESNSYPQIHQLKSQIKIEVLAAQWEIVPNKDNTLTVEYTFTADPKGNLPFWLMKRLSLKGIEKTMRNINEQLPSSKWQLHHLPNIKELALDK